MNPCKVSLYGVNKSGLWQVYWAHSFRKPNPELLCTQIRDDGRTQPNTEMKESKWHLKLTLPLDCNSMKGNNLSLSLSFSSLNKNQITTYDWSLFFLYVSLPLSNTSNNDSHIRGLEFAHSTSHGDIYIAHRNGTWFWQKSLLRQMLNKYTVEYNQCWQCFHQLMFKWHPHMGRKLKWVRNINMLTFLCNCCQRFTLCYCHHITFSIKI